MADIIQFTPKAELAAEQNLAAFVLQCRDSLTAFGADLPFDDDVWDVSEYIQRKGRRTVVRVVFSSLEASQAKQRTPTMAPGFQAFAKAYFRYMYALRPTTVFAERLAALRLVDAALSESGHAGCVTAITHDTLNRAVGLALERYSESSAHNIAVRIENLAAFLLESQLVEMKTKWVKPIKKARELNLRVGKAGDAARAKAMPSVAAIRAMAHVFVHAEEPVELYIGAILALLHCAPQRINETVRLTVDCEVEQKDLSGAVQYGLRWPPSKGFKNSIKWILPSMADVARKAITMLKAASAEARAIARWYEEHSQEIYLHPRVEHLRSAELLRPEEVSLILIGEKDAKAGKMWCVRENVPRRNGMYTFDDIQDRVLKKLPKGFPYAQAGLKFSDSLFTIRRFEFDAGLRAYTCIVDYLGYDLITGRLGRRGSLCKSVFERFELTEDDGSPVSLTTHQVRHYLNTLAQANCASQIDIAMWSGRADVGQNKAYDHVTPERIMSSVRELATVASPLFGGSLDTPKIRVVARRDEAGQLVTGSAHITDYGFCTHDYAMSPCQLHADCLNCNELVCVKGDLVKTENIRRLRDQTEMLLRQAEEAEQCETYGASRWVVHHRKTLANCDQLLAILNSTTVPEGASIRLAGVKPASRLEQARAQRLGELPVALSDRPMPLIKGAKRA